MNGLPQVQLMKVHVENFPSMLRSLVEYWKVWTVQLVDPFAKLGAEIGAQRFVVGGCLGLMMVAWRDHWLNSVVHCPLEIGCRERMDRMVNRTLVEYAVVADSR